MKLKNLLAIMMVAILATGVVMAGKCGSKKSSCGKCDKAKTEAVAKAKCSGKCAKEGKEKCDGKCTKASAKKCCGTCDKAKAAKKSCSK